MSRAYIQAVLDGPGQTDHVGGGLFRLGRVGSGKSTRSENGWTSSLSWSASMYAGFSEVAAGNEAVRADARDLLGRQCGVVEPADRGLAAGLEMLRPVHTVGLVAMGLWLLDDCELGECATTATGLGRWDFHLTVVPIRFAGTSGSPVNPITTF